LATVDKRVENVRILISDAGAAGTAVTRFLLAEGARDVIVLGAAGVLHSGMDADLGSHERWLAAHTNPRCVPGAMSDAIVGADVFIGLSGTGGLTSEHVVSMAGDAIVFALADPTPALDAAVSTDRVAVVAAATPGHPNHVSDLVALPGVFAGALNAKATQITPAMELAACDALAELGAAQGQLLPGVLDPDVVPMVAARVAAATASTCAPAAARLLSPVGGAN
jgi:malate dehydrogenase (oxaloacetate-decarboxylating)